MNGYRVSFWSDENVLELDSDDGYEYTKNHLVGDRTGLNPDCPLPWCMSWGKLLHFGILSFFICRKETLIHFDPHHPIHSFS